MTEQCTFLLLHSPLVGPLSWEFTAESLRRGGARAIVPPLTAVIDRGPGYYERFAAAAGHALGVGQGPVVLVGHSGAGALLPSVARTVGKDVRAAVFVDALLPHPGQSFFDTVDEQLRDRLTALARGDRLPPWNEWFPLETFDALLPDSSLRDRFIAELPEVPLDFFTERAPEDGLPVSRCAYVRLSGAYDECAEQARRRGWWVHREEADHLAMLTRPDDTADLLLRAASAVLG